MLRTLTQVMKRSTLVQQSMTSARHWQTKGNGNVISRGRMTAGPLLAPSVTSNRHASTAQATTTTEPKIVRKLGQFENYLSQDAEDKHWFANFFIHTVRSQQEITEDQWRLVFAAAQKRYDCLRYTIVKKNGERYYAEVPDAPDFKVVQSKDEFAVLEQESTFNFKPGELLWRIRLLEPEQTSEGFLYRYAYASQNGLIDGLSAANVGATFLDYLEKFTAADVTSSDLSNIESLPHLPSRESAIQTILTSESSETEVRGNADDFFEGRGNRSLARKLAEMYKTKNPHVLGGVRTIIVGLDDLTRLRHAAKRNGVTINSVCTSAIAIATFKFLTEKEVLSSDDLMFSGRFVSSLRHLVNQPIVSKDHHTSSYYADCVTEIPVTKHQAEASDTGPFWEIAKFVEKDKRDLHSRKQPLIEAINFTEWCDSIGGDVLNYAGADPDHFVNGLTYIANLTNFNYGAENTRVQLHQLLGMGTKPELFCFLLTGVNGVLNINLDCNTMIIPDELGEHYLSNVKKELYKVIESETA